MLGLILKILVLVSTAILIRGTLPRYRVDQLISQHWKSLIFIYIFFILNFFYLIHFFI